MQLLQRPTLFFALKSLDLVQSGLPDLNKTAKSSGLQKACQIKPNVKTRTENMKM